MERSLTTTSLAAEPSTTAARLARFRRPGPLVIISVLYLLAVSGLMIWRGISVSPDYLFALMVPVALLSGRFVRFLGDWVPFVAVFLGWEAMRGLASETDFPPHVGDLAAVERTLFGGHIPSVVLQEALHRGGVTTAIDYAATVVYFGHFVVPITVGLVIWLIDRTHFLRYTTAFMGMAMAAFVVFLLVPTAPPWYAQNHGDITGLTKIIGTTLPSAVSPYYTSLNPNPVAAFPSLHAAFPFLGFLALRRVSRPASWIALGWCVAVWFSVVYLGEHYVVDVIAGVALATVTWALVTRVLVPRVAILRGPDGAAPLARESAPPLPASG